jgi:hypothetical protein
MARALSETFAGIDVANAPAFVIAQLTGALVAFWFFGWLLETRVRQVGNGRSGSVF